jgi:hypothetical protein
MPSYVISPQLQSGVYAALVPFITLVTGLAAANVVQGLPNRASMPMPGFISMQAIFRHRLRTNLHLPVNPAGGGTQAIEEGVELSMQIDCYGPQSTDEIEGAEDWATILSTTLRDEYGVSQLQPAGVVPLYADDARMIPLVAGEDQYEERWSVDARFQYNPQTTIPQQSADVLKLLLLNVQERYPA